MINVEEHKAFELDETSFKEGVALVIEELTENKDRIIAISVTLVYDSGEASNVALGDLELLHELQTAQLTELSTTLAKLN